MSDGSPDEATPWFLNESNRLERGSRLSDQSWGTRPQSAARVFNPGSVGACLSCYPFLGKPNKWRPADFWTRGKRALGASVTLSGASLKALA